MTTKTSKMNRILISLILLVPAVVAYSQDFAITSFELAGDKLIISYNLADTVKNRHYTVRLYASHDNFLNPLTELTGDAGLEVVPGLNKKIIWNAGKELGASFSGRIAIEVRGREYVPFVRLTGFEGTKSVKRLVPFTVTWTGGTRQNVLNFDLYQGETKVLTTKAGVGNTGNTELTLSRAVRPGRYRFRISDAKNSEDVVFSSEFAVKRRLPLVIPIAVMAGVGYAVYEIIDGPEKPTGMVDPPCPGGGDECNN